MCQGIDSAFIKLKAVLIPIDFVSGLALAKSATTTLCATDDIRAALKLFPQPISSTSP